MSLTPSAPPPDVTPAAAPAPQPAHLTANGQPFSVGALLSRFWLPILAVLGVALGVVWYLSGAFNDRRYAPAQPIAFSHARHAGELGIDCQYCHFNARSGKHAGVPPMATCLGCHKNLGVASDKPEIAKLLKIAEEGSYLAGPDGRIVASDKERDALIAAGTPPVRNEGGVVHWNRVHKLPDHVFFTHDAHIAAGVSCETCHGPVREMAVMRQHADLTMGWCLECHRSPRYVSDPVRGLTHPREPFVGTASYLMAANAEQPRPVAVFAPPAVAGIAPASTAGAHARPAAPATAADSQTRFHAKLDALVRAHPDLPRWKVADLPVSHRAFYTEVLGRDLTTGPGGRALTELEIRERLLHTYMSAPTQCSTCHQ